ncbi:MAG: aminotransferase class I/II-fold pyridoxal phosphate-dependent enzyme, partial [Thermoprotei archaeon]
MTPEPSRRLGRLPPYVFAELERLQGEYERSGVKFISLGIGDPDLPPPTSLVEEVVKALRQPHSHNYSTSEGEHFFRRAVAEWYERRYGVHLDPDTEVCSLIGSKEGLANIGRAYLNPGDSALIPNPGYPVYAQGAAILSDAKPIEYDLDADAGFQPRFEGVRVEGGTKLLFLNYPSNPTGAIATRETLKGALEFAKRNNLLMCYDNAYGELVFNGAHSL